LAVLAFKIRIILTLPSGIPGKVLDVVKFVNIPTDFEQLFLGIMLSLPP